MAVAAFQFSNKKGIMYTILGIFLIGILLTAYFSAHQSVETPILFLDERLLSVNEFLQGVKTDASFALETGSLRAMLAMSEYISANYSYIDDVELRIDELLRNETLYTQSYVIMTNNSLESWRERIEGFATQFSVQINISYGNVTLNQSSPWLVDVYVPLTIQLRDPLSNASWQNTDIVSAHVQIGDISDPLWIVETGNNVVRTFNKTPYDVFVDGVDATNLTDHIELGYYTQFHGAPSILMRYEGDFGAGGAYGIESLVDKPYLSLFIPVTEERSNVDYVYFDGSSPTIYNFSIGPATLRLDNSSSGGTSHIEKYGLESSVS